MLNNDSGGASFWHGSVTRVALFHAVFANYGDVSACIMNFMAVPIRELFADSLHAHYCINATVKSAEFEFIYSSIASTFFFGVLFGGVIMGQMMDNYGRKGTTVHVRDIIAIVSSTCLIAAKFLNWIELFVVGQFLAGVVSALKHVLFIYMAECAPDKKRGLTTMAIGAGGNLLILLAAPLSLPAVFGTTADWWLLPAMCAALAAVHLLVAGRQFPESPKHLFIERRMYVTARHAVRFYHGDDANVDSVIEEYKRERNLVHHRHVTLRDVAKSRRLRWCLAILLINALVPATSLMNVKSQYMQTMLMRLGLGQSTAMLWIMLITAVTAPLCVAAPFLVERFGRRPVFLVVSALTSVELALVGAAQAVGIDSPATAGGPLGAALGLAGFGIGNTASMLGLLSMNSVLLGEMCPHAARTLFAKISLILPISLSLIGVISYPTVVARYGKVFFAPPLFINIVLFIASVFLLPETRERSVDAIFKSLGGTVFSKQTRRHSADSMAAIANHPTTPKSSDASTRPLLDDDDDDEYRSVASYGALSSYSDSTAITENGAGANF